MSTELTYIESLPLKYRHKLSVMQWVRFRNIELELKKIQL